MQPKTSAKNVQKVVKVTITKTKKAPKTKSEAKPKKMLKKLSK